METVTLSLETYNDMKAKIERLEHENKQKQIAVTPEWYRILTILSLGILGVALFIKILSFN